MRFTPHYLEIQFPNNPKHRSGFALIATISIMSLLVVIALGMMSLSKGELRSLRPDDAILTAQGNARMPLIFYGIDGLQFSFPDSSFRFINFINGPLTPFIVRKAKGKVVAGTRLFHHSENRERVLIFPPKEARKALDVRYFSDWIRKRVIVC